MTIRAALAITLLLPAALLGACHGRNKVAEQSSAAGEVLPGSVSDAMIPYDRLTSHPPLAPPRAAAKAAADDDTPAVDAATDSASDAASSAT